MAKRDKYRKKRSSDFFNYSEGKMSDRERNAFERRMQKDPFESDAAEGFSGISRDEAEEDMQSAAERIRMRVEGESSRNSIGRGSSWPTDNESRNGGNRNTVGKWRTSGNRSTNRSRRIAWYSAAAAIASLMIVATIFFQVNDNGIERFETAPEMGEAAREQLANKKSVPLQEAEVEQEEAVGKDAMNQDESAGEDGMAQKESMGEGAMEDQEVPEKQIQEDDATFPVTAGEDAKKGYDLKEMQLHQKEHNLDQETQAPEEELTFVADEEQQEIEEDHAFAWEKMDEDAAAGRYKETQQQMAAPEPAKEPEAADDLQAPLPAPDNVLPEQKIAGVSDQLTGTISGVVRSADDLEPLPGAVIKLKDSETGTMADMEGRFILEALTDDEETLEVSYIGMITEEVPATTDQPMEIALVPDQISLDEVVVVGHGSSKTTSMRSSTTAVNETEPSGSVEYENAVPENGLAEFRSYIDTALVYPEPTETSGKEVVVLKFSVAPDGRPQNFRVIRAPENEAFEKEAIRVVSEGPAWQPATRNGQYTDEEVRLRIAFRKD